MAKTFYEGWENIEMFDNRVCSLLGIETDELSHQTLMYPENAPLAEMIIKGKVTFWQELTEEQIPIFESCVVYQTAIRNIRLAISNREKVNQTPTLKLEFFEDDGLDLLAELEEMLELLLNQLLYDTFEYPSITQFTVTNRG